MGMMLTRLDDLQPKATKNTGKKPAPAPYSKGSSSKSNTNPLFESRPRHFGIGMWRM